MPRLFTPLKIQKKMFKFLKTLSNFTQRFFRLLFRLYGLYVRPFCRRQKVIKHIFKLAKVCITCYDDNADRFHLEFYERPRSPPLHNCIKFIYLIKCYALFLYIKLQRSLQCLNSNKKMVLSFWETFCVMAVLKGFND